MYRPVYLILLSLLAIGYMAKAQDPDSVRTRKHRLALYLGAGPSLYFNNLQVSRDRIDPWNYSLTARFMWEPEHFLSLGLETGYYRLYSANFPQGTGGPTRIVKTAVPVSLVTSIRFLRGGYANVSIGQTCLTSWAEGAAIGETATSRWSLADFGISAGYRYRVINRISIGIEAKSFYSSKYQDGNVAILAMVSYQF